MARALRAWVIKQREKTRSVLTVRTSNSVSKRYLFHYGTADRGGSPFNVLIVIHYFTTRQRTAVEVHLMTLLFNNPFATGLRTAVAVFLTLATFRLEYEHAHPEHFCPSNLKRVLSTENSYSQSSSYCYLKVANRDLQIRLRLRVRVRLLSARGLGLSCRGHCCCRRQLATKIFQ